MSAPIDFSEVARIVQIALAQGCKGGCEAGPVRALAIYPLRPPWLEVVRTWHEENAPTLSRFD